ncbi:MAG TPA: hypothetical protein VH415_17785, partial [Nitrososphaeraceae archaeon]
MKVSSVHVLGTVALAAVACMLVSPPLLLTNKAFSMGQISSTSRPTLATFQPSPRLLNSGVRFVMDSSITPITMKVAQNIAMKDPPRVHKIVLIAKEENLTLPQGNKISAYTWNGTVPSP